MNQNRNISWLIFEWIPWTGKSTTLEALIGHSKWINKKYKSEVILSEHQTQRVLENIESNIWLKKSDNISHLEKIIEHLEFLNDNLGKTLWSKNNRVNHKIPFILERFHLTHCYHYDHLSWEDLSEIDKRLNGINSKICLFIIDDKDIEDRIINDYNKQWRWDYLQKYWKDKNEIIEYFIKKQKELIEISKKSCLPVKIINTSEKNIDNVVEDVLNFWWIF